MPDAEVIAFDRVLQRAITTTDIVKHAEALIRSAENVAFRDSTGLQITMTPAFEDLKAALRSWRNSLD